MLRLCKLLSTVKILLFLTRDFLCHVQGSEFTETFASELDLDKGYFQLIEFTESFFSGYVRSRRCLNFFVKNKSVKTILPL